MRALFISAEVAPFAKVGGLADVAGGLPKALVEQGVDCRVIMPLYKMIETDPRWSLKQIKARLEVKMNPEWTQSASLWEYEHDGVLHYFIGCDRWFSNAVDSSTLYQPGGDLHAFFAAAVFRACEELGWIPEVLHANDWHTGFVPVLLRESFVGSVAAKLSKAAASNSAFCSMGNDSANRNTRRNPESKWAWEKRSACSRHALGSNAASCARNLCTA